MTDRLSTVVDHILAQAVRRPDSVAVRQWDTRITYRELADRCAALARQLRARGVGPEHRVGLALPRTADLVVAMVAIMRAGAAWVPLPPQTPPARKADLVADAGIDVIVTAAVDGQVTIDGRAGADGYAGVDGYAGDGSALDCPAGPGNAAYVLYTSGSTGRPKGVVITHRSVLSFAEGLAAVTGLDEHGVALGFAAITFDVAVLDILVPLANGAQVALAPDSDRTDPARLQRFVAEHAVSWGCLPVSLLPLLEPDRLPAWRTVITGAEAPGPEQVLRWAGPAHAPHRRFFNCYGPTEATVCASGFETAGSWSQPVPMGRALPGHRLHVVDADLTAVPPGVPGELLIGGDGLARGYLGSPGLTAARFIPDPFGTEPGARLYRTGDRVVELPDGNLLYLGRLDRQVKIRGQRVEPAETEAVLGPCPGAGQVAVDAVPGPAGATLVAFHTGPATADVLQAWCRDRLPAAAVPTRFVAVDRMPLTDSGKVDLAALRELDQERSIVDESGPAATSVLARLWTEVLGSAPGPGADFFAAGGHSIAAMRLVAAVREQLGRVITVEDVYGARTYAALAERAATAPPLDGGDVPTGSPPALSAAQRRLWFVDKLAPDAAAYNIALAERLRGRLDVAALRRALAAVARRHDVLRWRIPDRDGEPYVVVDPPVDEAEVRLVEAGPDELPGVLAAAAAQRFTLATGPLWTATLVRLAPDEHVLALTFHHAVFDGWSQRPYLADLSRAYVEATATGGSQPATATGGSVLLPDLTVRYADFVAWRAERDAARGRADLDWWEQHLAGAPPVLDLPRDHPRPPVQSYAGAQAGAWLSPAAAAAVRALGRDLGATVPTVLLAALAELLGRVTGRDDLVIGTPAADRRHAAFHPLVGFFIDIVALRARRNPADSFADRVRAASDGFLAALAHPSAPLEQVVQRLGTPRDPGRPALVQVLFNVYNFPEPQLSLPGVVSTREASGLPGSAFDQTWYVVERDGGYAVEVTYNQELYAPERMTSMVAAYVSLVERACTAPYDVVGDWDMPQLDRLAAGTVDPAPPPRGPVAGSGAAPVTATEHLVAAVWCDVLGRDRVGATDNFFDAGGSSMAAVVVQARLADAVGREVAVVDLFRYPTVRALAAHLDDGVRPAGGRVELERVAQRAAARRERGRTRTAGRLGAPREERQ